MRNQGAALTSKQSASLKKLDGVVTGMETVIKTCIGQGCPILLLVRHFPEFSSNLMKNT